LDRLAARHAPRPRLSSAVAPFCPQHGLPNRAVRVWGGDLQSVSGV
jgi:hypothetical protein